MAIQGNVCVRRSQKGGLGVFAAQKFEAGDRIRARLILRELASIDDLAGTDQIDRVTMIDDRLVLVGAPDCYLNHSCDPNAYLAFQGHDAELIARRAIAKNDEITLDYLINNGGGDSWQCSCGAQRCRGVTGSSFFDLPLAIKREYLPFLADWFRVRYKKEMKRLESELAASRD